MRIKKLSDDEYFVLGKRHWTHLESDRLGAIKRLLKRKPNANIRTNFSRAEPTRERYIELGKKRMLRLTKDRIYNRKRTQKKILARVNEQSKKYQ